MGATEVLNNQGELRYWMNQGTSTVNTLTGLIFSSTAVNGALHHACHVNVLTLQTTTASMVFGLQISLDRSAPTNWITLTSTTLNSITQYSLVFNRYPAYYMRGNITSANTNGACTLDFWTMGQGEH